MTTPTKRKRPPRITPPTVAKVPKGFVSVAEAAEAEGVQRQAIFERIACGSQEAVICNCAPRTFVKPR